MSTYSNFSISENNTLTLEIIIEDVYSLSFIELKENFDKAISERLRALRIDRSLFYQPVPMNELSDHIGVWENFPFIAISGEEPVEDNTLVGGQDGTD